MTREVFETLVEMRQEQGLLDAAEAEIIREALDIEPLTVRDCMVPRVDVTLLSSEESPAKAAAILDRLQDDPQARHLADSLEFARQWQRIEEAAQRAEARAEGIEEGLRRAVLAVCEVLGLTVPTEGVVAMAEMDAASLERLLATIKTSRAWPGSP